MIEKKFYLTKRATDKLWHYVGDPLHPNRTIDAGLVEVEEGEIRVDEYGAFVTKMITKQQQKQLKKYLRGKITNNE